jgi:hypothetical protein
MSSLTEYFPELNVQRPAPHDNSALRARLAGTKVADRSIVTELHRAMEERGAFAGQSSKR